MPCSRSLWRYRSNANPVLAIGTPVASALRSSVRGDLASSSSRDWLLLISQDSLRSPVEPAHPAVGSNFLRGGARPPRKEVVAFIDAHRDNKTDGRRWGLEPICTELKIAPSTYYDTKARPPSNRAIPDATTGPLLLPLWDTNYSVYGRRKLWKAADGGTSTSDGTRWPASCVSWAFRVPPW